MRILGAPIAMSMQAGAPPVEAAADSTAMSEVEAEHGESGLEVQAAYATAFNRKAVKEEEDKRKPPKAAKLVEQIRTFRRQAKDGRGTIHGKIGGQSQVPITKPSDQAHFYKGTKELPITIVCLVQAKAHAFAPGAIIGDTWLSGSGPPGGVVHLYPRSLCDEETGRPFVFPLFVGHDAEWSYVGAFRLSDTCYPELYGKESEFEMLPNGREYTNLPEEAQEFWLECAVDEKKHWSCSLNTLLKQLDNAKWAEEHEEENAVLVALRELDQLGPNGLKALRNPTDPRRREFAKKFLKSKALDIGHSLLQVALVQRNSQCRPPPARQPASSPTPPSPRHH